MSVGSAICHASTALVIVRRAAAAAAATRYALRPGVRSLMCQWMPVILTNPVTPRVTLPACVLVTTAVSIVRVCSSAVIGRLMQRGREWCRQQTSAAGRVVMIRVWRCVCVWNVHGRMMIDEGATVQRTGSAVVAIVLRIVRCMHRNWMIISMVTTGYGIFDRH